MKNLFKKVVTIGAVAGAFVTGYFVNENDSVKVETPVQAETKQADRIAVAPNDERNVFTQYFTITELDEKGADVQNQYNEKDKYYIDKHDFDTDFDKLQVGTKIAVTFDHDTTITAELDTRETYIFNVIDSKEYGIEIDNDKFVFAVNKDNSADMTTIDKKDYVIGDMVEVTFKDNDIEIATDKKIGSWKDKEKIVEKVVYKENENTEKLVQQNTEIVKENEELKNKAKQESQKNEVVKKKEEPKKEQPKSQNEQKVNKNVETPKTEQKQVKKEENTEKQETAKNEQKQEIKKESSDYKKDPNEGKQGYIQDGNGKWITEKEYDDMAFKENAENDPNRNNPNYVQTEDGSFVPKNFWD
ncbi:hypothetical protein Kirov_274 [Bacillus phage Kirov]|uniref:Uncharacterized protein n=1 Tax=Bacillus phage Kirov TaxID=2783539 RepID=A0A7U3NKS2_9CAUD|nr:tail length tape measure protein [Bacillus phage Kirov]QOV08473.1 hypothetical protein Kirov_274 [Bacillus phage Kirov]